MANANCGCGGNQPANQNVGCTGVIPFKIGFANQQTRQGENCAVGVEMTPTMTFGAAEMCDPCPQGAPMPKWVPWLIGGILGLLLFGILIWALLGGPRTSVASATMAPQQFAQAGQPVSATANPSATAVVNFNGVPIAQAGGQPPAKAKPSAVKLAVPSGPCKAVVFDPNGPMDRFGVALTVDGTNYAISQINDGKLASPNDILAAQAAKKEWVTVVLDPSGPYAVNHKGNIVPVTMDNGRILVSANQISI